MLTEMILFRLSVNTYPGQPGYVSSTAATTAGPTTAFTSLPDSTMTPYPRNDTNLPLANRTRDDCSAYFDGFLFAGINLTIASSASAGADSLGLFTDFTPCSIAADIFHADLESFGHWNPSLGNTTLPNCTFEPELRYCGQLYFNASTPISGDNQTYGLEIRVSLLRPCLTSGGRGCGLTSRSQPGFIDSCTRFDDVPEGWTW